MVVLGGHKQPSVATFQKTHPIYKNTRDVCWDSLFSSVGSHLVYNENGSRSDEKEPEGGSGRNPLKSM